MPARSYSDIRDEISRELGDITAPDAREAVIEHLTRLTFELGRVKQQQSLLRSALRARDILLRERSEPGSVEPAALIELDPRDALDPVDGLYDIEWDKEVAYRWTGPGHDTLIGLWLDRAIPIICEIELFSYGDVRNRGAIALTVDGVPVRTTEAGEKLLRSDPFPVVGGSCYSEVGIHVPRLTGGPALAEAAPAGRRPDGRRRRVHADGTGDVGGDQRVRGIAFTHMRFLSST
jgi:hypothetical protein